MKKKILLILLVGFCFNAIAQKTSTSSATAFDIRKKVEPPIVQFLEPPTFIDDNGNNAIDALENFKIVFKLKNSGKGDALNLRALLTTTGASQLRTCTRNFALLLTTSLIANCPFRTTELQWHFSVPLDQRAPPIPEVGCQAS